MTSQSKNRQNGTSKKLCVYMTKSCNYFCSITQSFFIFRVFCDLSESFPSQNSFVHRKKDPRGNLFFLIKNYRLELRPYCKTKKPLIKKSWDRHEIFNIVSKIAFPLKVIFKIFMRGCLDESS
jgi:hypothetical protein